jgi:exopolysaccharide production protein ExoZ
MDSPTFFGYHGEFLAGVLAYLALPYLQRIKSVFLLMLGCGLFWLIMFYPGDRTLLPIALFFLIAGLATIKLPGSIASTSLISLGDASYSIYLIHPLVFLLAKSATVVFHSATWAEEPLRYAAITVTVIVSLLGWKFFEQPFIRLGEIAVGKKVVRAVPEPSAG